MSTAHKFMCEGCTRYNRYFVASVPRSMCRPRMKLHLRRESYVSGTVPAHARLQKRAFTFIPHLNPHTQDRLNQLMFFFLASGRHRATIISPASESGRWSFPLPLLSKPRLLSSSPTRHPQDLLTLPFGLLCCRHFPLTAFHASRYPINSCGEYDDSILAPSAAVADWCRFYSSLL